MAEAELKVAIQAWAKAGTETPEKMPNFYYDDARVQNLKTAYIGKEGMIEHLLERKEMFEKLGKRPTFERKDVFIKLLSDTVGYFRCTMVIEGIEAPLLAIWYKKDAEWKIQEVSLMLNPDDVDKKLQQV